MNRDHDTPTAPQKRCLDASRDIEYDCNLLVLWRKVHFYWVLMMNSKNFSLSILMVYLVRHNDIVISVVR